MEIRELHLRGAVGPVRTEMYDGREHLVVPVVALQEAVIHAINASTPEFVTAQTLTKAATSWNGRPLVLGHPVRNGRQISANDAKVLEAQGFGTIFNSRMSGSKLLMDAFIDPVKAERVGGTKFLERLKNGEMVECSVGAFVTTDNVAGNYNGKPYKATWLDTTGDHLAFLPNGIGACSIEMGCGAHRTASAYLVTAEGLEEIKFKTLDVEGSAGEEATESADYEAGEDSVHVGGFGYGVYQIGKHTALSVHRTHKSAAKKARRLAQATNLPHKVVRRVTGETTMKTAEKGASMEKPSLYERLKALVTDAAPETLEGPLPDKAQVGGYAVGDTVQINKPGHTAHGKVGKIKKSLKGGRVHSVGSYGTFHKSQLKAAGLRTADVLDTPSEAASEEAAELVGYQTLRSLFDGIGKSWDEASGLINDLISDETDDPTETPADEEAEEEVETARLEAIQTLCTSMMGSLSAIMNTTNNLLSEDDDEAMNVTPRYMKAKMEDCPTCGGSGNVGSNPCPTCDGKGEIRSAAGARHSGTDMQMIQTVHDHAVDLGAKCARDYKAMETNVVLEVNGKKIADVVADGLKAACSCEENGQMNKPEVIKSLIENKHSGFTADDQKMLEAASDERLQAFHVVATTKATEVKAAEEAKAAEVRAAEDKKTAELRAAQDATEKIAAAKPLTTEEWTAAAPPELKTLIARAKAQDAARSTELVGLLKAAQSEFTEDELKAEPLERLERMARAMKIEEPIAANFAGRGIPRSAEQSEDVFANPPDPYAAGLKALREQRGDTTVQ